MALAFSPRFSITAPERVTYGPNAIPALLVAPDAPGRHPGAIVQHGFGADKNDFLPLALGLAAYGFVTLLPDAWGHGERFADDQPNWRTNRTPDFFLTALRHTAAELREAVTALVERPDVQPDALLVGGFSMGAMAALLVGVEDARVSAIASIAGASATDLLGVTFLGTQPPGDQALEWARAHDVAPRIGQFAPKPLLLSHGRSDDLVPVRGAERIYEAAKPFYAQHPDRLALKLYDHAHTVSEQQAFDALNWIAPFFLDGDDGAA